MPFLLMANFLAVSSNAATAFELFGVCLFGTCQSEAEQDAIRFLDPLRYEAAITVSGSDEVQDAVKSASKVWIGRNEAVGGSAALISAAQADYRNILAALYGQGHYGGQISILINGREVDRLPIGEELSETPQVAINVEPGPVFSFGQTDIANAPSDWTAPASFKTGETARAPAVGNAAREAIDEWRAQGYALATLADENITARHDERVLNVSLELDPGPVAYLGGLEIRGTDRMNPAFVARMTGLQQGEIYDPKALRRAVKRLERLGVFAVQRFEEGDALDASGQLPLTLIVEERKPRRIGFGATVSNIEGLGAEAFWLHRNLFGQAERLRLDAEISGIGTTLDVRDFTYGLGAKFEKPGVFTIDTVLEAEAFALRETNETFTETSGRISVGLSHRYSERLLFGGLLFGEYAEFERLETDEKRAFTTFGLETSVEYDGRDDKLNPTKGIYASSTLTAFHEFNFGNFGAKLDGELRYYQSFSDSDRFVLATRLKAGSIIGPSPDETPDDLLFYAGGGGSVRGYGFKNIAIIEPDGTKRGGQSVVEASVEARVRFTDNWGGVLFADAGSVSDGAGFNNIDEWRTGIGAGVRYNTGLGPLRLDVAVPLQRKTVDPVVGVYAGIGQAF